MLHDTILVSRAEIAIHEKQIEVLKARIAGFQCICAHKYLLESQTNLNSEIEWRKKYRCSLCDKEHSVDGPQVYCGTCHNLAIAITNKQGNIQKFATTMKVPTPDGSPDRIRGFRCTDEKCQQITLLWVEGD